VFETPDKERIRKRMSIENEDEFDFIFGKNSNSIPSN
jgi:hypothetical protein